MTDGMKIRIERAALADAAAWVAQATPKRPAAPALAGIKITAEEGSVSLRGFDYETAHEARVDADVISPGEVLVSAKFLCEIVSAIKGATVELVLDGARLAITAGRSTYRVGAMRVEDYPNLPAFPELRGSIDRDALTAAITTVDFAAARSEIGDLGILTAINIAGEAELVKFSATDRFAIGRTYATWGIADPGAVFTANVPLSALPTALKGMTDTIDIGVEGGAFGLSDGRRTVITRVMDDSFPKLDRFFEIRAGITATVETRDLADAIKRASLVSDDHGRVVLTFATGEVAITSDSESGDSVEYVDCEADGEIEIVFDGRKVMAALLSVGDGPAQLEFTDPGKPLVIRPTDVSHAAAVVMPRRKI